VTLHPSPSRSESPRPPASSARSSISPSSYNVRPVEAVLDALKSQGFGPRASSGGWLSRCPAHDDSRPSLKLDVAADGRLLLRCFSRNCSATSIIEKLGLPREVLFTLSDHRSPAPRPEHGQAPSGKKLFKTAKQAVEALEHYLGPRSASWSYRDAAGKPTGLVVRWDARPSRPKEVRPIALDVARGGWYVGAMPAPRPAWRLPELLAAPLEREVLVCEGERAASVGLRLGFETTCSAMGAGSARRTCWAWAKGRLVVISVDHDAAGEAYGRDVGEMCLEAGARGVKLIRLVDVWRDAPAGADLADLLKWPRLRSEQEAIGIVEGLIDRAKEVRP
jgi:hypothetical protein